MNKVPKEILLMVYSNLDYFVDVRLVCRFFNEVFDSDVAWK